MLTWVDIIELGLPFTDPIADGPTIQRANTVSTYRRSGYGVCEGLLISSGGVDRSTQRSDGGVDP